MAGWGNAGPQGSELLRALAIANQWAKCLRTDYNLEEKECGKSVYLEIVFAVITRS